MVSIIVPCYNVVEYLEDCADSLVHQTYKNIEIILVDDGSTDATGALCDQLADLHSNFRVVHKQNGGLASARNTGFEEASGEYVAFIDSDDFVHSQYIELLLKTVLENQSDFSFCTYRGYENVHEVREWTAKQYSFAQLQKENFTRENLNWELAMGTRFSIEIVVAWNKLYRREIFEKIQYPTNKDPEDEFFAHHLFNLTAKATYIDAPLNFYRENRAGSLGTNFKKSKNKKVEITKLWLERKNFYRKTGQKEAEILANFKLQRLDPKDNNISLPMLLSTLFYSKFSWKAKLKSTLLYLRIISK